MISLYIPDYDWKGHILFEIFSLNSEGSLQISSLASDYFSLVDDPADADWILIPAFISSLTNSKGKAFIKKVSDQSESSKKPFGVFSNSDLIIDPGVENAIIFTPGAYSSRSNLVELPAILPMDPLEKWFGGIWKPWNSNGPVLGFCGQATLNPAKTLKDALTVWKLKRKKKKGNSPYLLIPNFFPAWERGRLLKSLQHSSIRTEFIFRTRYKGGANSPEEKEKVEQDFYENISNSLMTVCMRGMGNYSVRFYQTLALGRIPLWIDSDARLPFEDKINYEEFILRVPYKDRFNSERYIAEFLAKTSQEDLLEKQKRARKCWEENFQPKGMLINLGEYLSKVATEK